VASSNVCAVVLNWNSAQDTIECVRSLRATGYPGLSIVVVDNASSDDSVTSIRSAVPDVHLLVQPSNGGYASGNNAGIRWSLEHQADFVLVLNNDVTVEPDFIDRMLDCAGRHPKAGIIGGRVFYADQRERIFCGASYFSVCRCTGVNKGNLRARMQKHGRERNVDYISGVLLFVRSQVFKDLGLFDERFFMYYEDLEFARRVTKRFRIIYNPAATAYHKSGGGTGWRTYTDLYLYYQTRNRIWVFDSDPPLYRVYVAAFTIGITILKTIVISLNFHGNPSGTKRQLGALWRGLRDGLFTS